MRDSKKMMVMEVKLAALAKLSAKGNVTIFVIVITKKRTFTQTAKTKFIKCGIFSSNTICLIKAQSV